MSPLLKKAPPPGAKHCELGRCSNGFVESFKQCVLNTFFLSSVGVFTLSRCSLVKKILTNMTNA
jgi:hypothetical protein